MIQKAKALSFVVIVVLAMSAVIGQTAQAATAFHSEASSTEIKGEQSGEMKFVTSGGTMKCRTTTMAGAQSEREATTVTLKPNYSECILFGFVGGVFDTNNCGYVYHMVNGSSPPTATTDVECTNAGEAIALTAGSCVTHIPQQTGLKHVVFSNTGIGSTRDIDANFTIEGITYTETSGCFAPGTRSNGTLTGSVTIKGFSGGVQVGIWAE